MLSGIRRHDGAALSGDDYLKDRIQSCLSMREGTHPMRRLKGSRLPDLIDRPLNQATLFEIKVAVFDALASPANGMNEMTVSKVEISHVESGRVSLSVVIKVEGRLKTLGGIEVTR